MLYRYLDLGVPLGYLKVPLQCLRYSLLLRPYHFLPHLRILRSDFESYLEYSECGRYSVDFHDRYVYVRRHWMYKDALFHPLHRIH